MKKAMRILCLPVMAVTLLFLMAGAQPQQTGSARVFTDDAGRQIKLNGVPQRIVSLSPAVTETLYAIGAGDKVVGVTDFCNYPAAALQKPKVGGFADINMETVISLSPDLVVAATLHIPRIVPALEKFNIPVVINDPQTIIDVVKNIRFTGRVTGLEKQADSLAAELETKYKHITEKITGQIRPTVFWELSDDFWTAGPGSFINDLINQAGGKNIAAGTKAPWAQLSAEIIIGEDPDYVFLADHPYGADIVSAGKRPGWEQLSAVKKKHIIEIQDVNLISRPGPRVMEALEYIARILHPEAFK